MAGVEKLRALGPRLLVKGVEGKAGLAPPRPVPPVETQTMGKEGWSQDWDYGL